MVTAEFTRQLLALHGEVRPQPRMDWIGPFPLPESVEQFYCEVGPASITVEMHGNPFFLPCLAELWNFQAGYRWNGLSGEPIEDWNDAWLVVADAGGDPFIFDRTSSAVLHAYHGEGEWDASEIFRDLNKMAACLAQLGSIVCEFRDEYLDEDCSIRPKFKMIALDRLKVILGTMSDSQAVLRVLGWI